jgi:acyl carrier protein
MGLVGGEGVGGGRGGRRAWGLVGRREIGCERGERPREQKNASGAAEGATRAGAAAPLPSLSPCPHALVRADLLPQYSSLSPPFFSLSFLSPFQPSLPHSTQNQTNKLSNTQVLADVRSIIAEQLGADLDKVGPDAKFADLGADSLDTVEIMMALEEKFEVTLDEDGAEGLSTVQDAADLISSKLA